MIQETRARELGLRQILRWAEASHWILASGESDSAGGVAILVSRTLSRERPVATEHVRGRVLEARLQDGTGDLALICIHNYDVGNHEMRRVATVLHALADSHAQALVQRRAVVIGDVNFGDAQAGVAGAARRRPDRLLASALARWVELPVTGATHVCQRAEARSAASTVSGRCCLDRSSRWHARAQVWGHSQNGCSPRV